MHFILIREQLSVKLPWLAVLKMVTLQQSSHVLNLRNSANENRRPLFKPLFTIGINLAVLHNIFSHVFHKHPRQICGLWSPQCIKPF